MEDEKWIGLTFSQFFGDKKPEVMPMAFAKAAVRACPCSSERARVIWILALQWKERS
jgi:hypothetical protein